MLTHPIAGEDPEASLWWAVACWRSRQLSDVELKKELKAQFLVGVLWDAVSVLDRQLPPPPLSQATINSFQKFWSKMKGRKIKIIVLHLQSCSEMGSGFWLGIGCLPQGREMRPSPHCKRDPGMLSPVTAQFCLVFLLVEKQTANAEHCLDDSWTALLGQRESPT